MDVLYFVRTSYFSLVCRDLDRVSPSSCSGLQMWCEALMGCFGHDPGDHSIKGYGRDLGLIEQLHCTR